MQYATTKLIKQADFSLLNLVEDRHIKMAIGSNLMIIQALNQQIDLLEHTLSKMRTRMKKIEDDYVKEINNEERKDTTT